MQRTTGLPSEMTPALRLLHRLLCLFDAVVQAVRDTKRVGYPRTRSLTCKVCRGRPPALIRGWCVHCVARWPSWHYSRGYGYPTKLEIWQGAPGDCWGCGAMGGGHHHGCGAVS